ncbi:MAG: hypothetical protein C0397_14470 [Odoribacter sp.]|nr:hypothetical protein [Odoribacter sp.]
MKFFLLFKLVISQLLIMLGAFLFMMTESKYVAKCLLIAGLISSIYIVIQFIIYSRRNVKYQ